MTSPNKKIEQGYDKVIELLLEIRKMVDDLCVYLLYDKQRKPRKVVGKK
jgi:hypothetical protein